MKSFMKSSMESCMTNFMPSFREIRLIKAFFSFIRMHCLGFFFIARTMLLLTGTLLISNTAFADVWDKLNSHEYQENENVEDYVWKEGDNKIPDYPQNNDLLEVSGPPAYQNYQYLLDGKNLQVGADGVVRYSIVIRSPAGSDNVMYEGLRCTTSQVKAYAYGSTDMDGRKKFIPRQNANWKPVSSSGVSGYSESLAVNYFCDHNGAILKRHEIIQNIKYGKGDVDGLYN